MGIFVTGLIALFGLIIMIPINYTGSFKDFGIDSNKTVTGLATISMANIDPDNPEDEKRFYAHSIASIFNTLVVCIGLYNVYRKYVSYRVEHLSRKRPENYTVRLSGFDKSYFTEDKIREYFDRISPDMVHQVKVVPYIPKLDNLRKKRFQLVKAKEANMIDFRKRLKDDNYTKTETKTSKILTRRIKKIDKKLEFLLANPFHWDYSTTEKIKDMIPSHPKLGLIYEKQLKDTAVGKAAGVVTSNIGEGLGKVVRTIDNTIDATVDTLAGFNIPIATEKTITNTAYITFKSIPDARICTRVVLGKTPQWDVHPAPEPNDILWPNHSPDIGSLQRISSWLVGVTIIFFLVFFWVIPTTLAAGLANLQTLSQLEFLDFIVEWTSVNPELKSIIEGLLPQLVILGFFLLLIPLIQYVTELTDYPRSRTSRTRLILRKYFVFKIVNIYMAGLLANSFFSIIDQLQDILERPLTLLDLLGTAIPTQASFFINFVVTSALRETTLRLLRPHIVIKELFVLYLWVKTPRDWKALYKPERFDYAEAYADRAFIMIVTLCYSSIAPLILPFGVLYFLIMYLTEKYKLLFTCKNKEESGGVLWTTVFNQLCIGVVLYHLTMIGVFVLRHFIFGIVISSILASLVLIFMWHMSNSWEPIATYGSLEHVIEVVDSGKEDLTIPESSKLFYYNYVHPSILPVPKKEQEMHYISEDDAPEIFSKKTLMKENVLNKEENLDDDDDVNIKDIESETDSDDINIDVENVIANGKINEDMVSESVLDEDSYIEMDDKTETQL
eukprot:TRINITY_DN4430_c0_g1_i2.p1 TRINITY_DN4430_c0_g1~~TRINITY_DN4430_c0_g1_i2.p1  ORF type:complete len:879 (+),score=125.77 TRINITY_DN4430_c0_g1_i2:286-2637(+)